MFYYPSSHAIMQTSWSCRGALDRLDYSGSCSKRLWNGQQCRACGHLCCLHYDLTWLTGAPMFFFVLLMCLLIRLPGDMTTLCLSILSLPPSPFLCFPSPHSPFIPGTGDLMKSSVTTSDLSPIIVSSFISPLLWLDLISADCLKKNNNFTARLLLHSLLLQCSVGLECEAAVNGGKQEAH